MTTHPSPALLARYADREADLTEVTVWSVEVHLEACAGCRARLATGTDELLTRVAAGLDAAIATGPGPAPRRRWSAALQRWSVWALVPWLVMTSAVLASAVLLQWLLPGLPGLVLLLAPVAPLPAVAGAWSRRLDPAWELIAGTPAVGLTMLLRRTTTVLALLVPVLALAGAGTGASLALALLPSLAFTAGTLALGAVVGVRRAAAGLGAVWALAVVAPAVVTADLPAVLRPGTGPAWALTALALVAVVAVVAARAGHAQRSTSSG